MEKIRDDLAADLYGLLWSEPPEEGHFDNPEEWFMSPNEMADRLIPLGWRKMLDVDGKPFCPTGYAQRYHDIGECDCKEIESL